MTLVIFEVGSWIWKMLMTLIVAIVVVSAVSIVVKNETNTIDVQRAAMIERILYSRDSFWVIENDMLKPGMVDRSRFTQATFDNNFVYRPNYGGAKLTIETTNGETIGPFYINQQTYDNLVAQVEGGTKYSGSTRSYTYPVTIVSGPNKQRGTLIMNVAMPRTT